MFNLGQICQNSESQIRKPTYRHQPVLCYLIKHAVLANQSVRYMETQYESFYHSRNKNQLTLRANSWRISVSCLTLTYSREVGEDLKHKEIKPALINEQSVDYKFECGWCDASYVGYTRRHLYQRIDEHKRSGSIFNHIQSQHPSRTIRSNMFQILKKCSGKCDCLLYERFLICEHKPCLNIRSDSIKAKLFT